MSKKTIIKSIIDYFSSCPLLSDEQDNINADNLPSEAKSFSVETVPCDETIKSYVDGSAKKQYLFPGYLYPERDRRIQPNIQ